LDDEEKTKMSIKCTWHNEFLYRRMIGYVLTGLSRRYTVSPDWMVWY